MYINIISSQISHHSPDDGDGDGLLNVGLLSTTDSFLAEKILSSSVATKASILVS
jgi:hypothetical protein